MKSIRSNLTMGLLAGLLFLWVGAGASVYLSVKRSLLKSIDAELAVDARSIRFAGRGETETDRSGTQRIMERAPQYFNEEGGSFFQIWDQNGILIEKSISLADQNLELPPEASIKPTFYTSKLSDGRTTRSMAYRATSGKGIGRRIVKVTAIAKDTSGVRSTLSSVLGGIILTGLLGGACATGLVRFVLRKGLKPLDELGEQASKIDLSASEIRFDQSHAPKELQPVYDRLNELMDRLAKGYEREKQFSSNLAHEIRTPISELKMISEIALKWPDQSGEQTHSDTLDIALQLERMTESLLMLGRVEMGQVALNLEQMNVHEFVTKKWTMYQDQALEKRVMMDYDVDTSLLWTADQNLMDHTLSNLMLNAVDYTPEGQTIKINNCEDTLEISNPAPHLMPDDIDLIFNRLWRADDSRTDSAHSGIGLSLARKCAEVQGFSLTAELKEGILKFSLINRSPSS